MLVLMVSDLNRPDLGWGDSDDALGQLNAPTFDMNRSDLGWGDSDDALGQLNLAYSTISLVPIADESNNGWGDSDDALGQVDIPIGTLLDQYRSDKRSESYFKNQKF
jgi:hypothetical protein